MEGSSRVGCCSPELAAAVLVLASVPLLAGGARASTSQRTRLDEAVQLAFESSPVLHGFEAEVAVARGRLRQANTFRYNPELGGGCAEEMVSIYAIGTLTVRT